MRIPPLSILATWPKPNYNDPTTHGPASLTVNIIFISLVLIAVTLRLYCRTKVKKWFGLDDIMIALALIFTVGLTVIVILAERVFFWNRHIYDIPISSIQNSNIIAMVAKLAFVLAATFTRLSLCCFYYRLVSDAGITWFRWTVHACTAFTVAVCVAFVFLTIFLCTPVSYYWVFPPVSSNGYCLDEGKATLAAGILNIIADSFTTLVPIPLVMRLQLPFAQRVGISVLFSLGFVVIIAGIVRTYYIWKGLMDSYDETWYAYPLWIAAAVEIDVGVICACAPALKTLLHFSPWSSRPDDYYTSSESRTPKQSNKTPPLSDSNSKSSLGGVLNATKSLAWSHRSRSRGSVWLEDPQPQDDHSWTDIKPQAQVRSGARYLEEEDSSAAPGLQINMRKSFELQSVRSLHREDSPEQYAPRFVSIEVPRGVGGRYGYAMESQS